MGVKHLLKRWMPPALVDGLRVLREPRRRVYADFAQAEAACQQGAYQHADLVRSVVEKNVRYRTSLASCPTLDLSALRTLLALAATGTGTTLRVLDFGGGGGAHCALARTVLGSSTDLRWNVVETPAMVQEASKKLADSKLKFFDDLDDARNDLGEIDLVFTSSALQYCPDPLQTLEALLALKARCVFITRTPFNASERSIVSVQHTWLSENGPGPLPDGFKDCRVLYPITYVSRTAVETRLNRGYRLRFLTDEGHGVFGIDGERVMMDGYFCERTV